MRVYEYSLKENVVDLESVLLDEWTKAYSSGKLFKFNLESQVPTKHLAGKHSFIVQKNSRRYTQKRPTDIQKSSSIRPTFDESKFNFTKVLPQEILLKLVNKDEEDKSENLILINNSPISVGHSLICPKYSEKKSQVLDEYSIKLACHILQLINSPNYLIGFNSIAAYASVNHLHMHLYDLKETNEFKINQEYLFPIQKCTKAHVYKNKVWFIDCDCYYASCFCVELDNFETLEQYANKVFSLINFMSVNDIAHNAVFVKSKSFKDQKETTKCFVWPKISAYDIPANEKNLCFAITELSGHFILPFDSDFESISEEFILDVARFVQPDRDHILKLRDNIFDLK